MATTPTASAEPASAPPRQRILVAASRIFYQEGIRSIGVERILTEAQVPRATFYRHFKSKEELVCVCLTQRHQAIKDQAQRTVPGLTDSRKVIEALVLGVDDEVCSPGFRGCAFIKAATEFPDPGHPVFDTVTAHRKWFRSVLTDNLHRTGHPEPERLAGVLVLLHDGGLMGGFLDDRDTAHQALRHALDLLSR